MKTLLILSFFLFPEVFAGNFYKEQKLQMKCISIKNNRANYIVRCENSEVICYRFYRSAIEIVGDIGSGLQCKFKNNQ